MRPPSGSGLAGADRFDALWADLQELVGIASAPPERLDLLRSRAAGAL